ncbi:unnamed protein product, partial [Choristocarpus tenellus]
MAQWSHRNLMDFEPCSSSCLTSVSEKCFNDESCEDGGLGCAAFGDQLCRFCGFADFDSCPSTEPTPAPAPTSTQSVMPTEVPRVVCSSSCLTSATQRCYDDSTCIVGGLGCNADGDFYCRFCGFNGFLDCPDKVLTPAPSPVTLA